MDDFQSDDQTEAAPDVLSTDPGPAWSGTARGPRPPAEGVRIIGAEEAAAAIEAGQVSPRVPDDAKRFGDVPEPPPGPQPPLRFPGSDPTAVAKPPVVAAPEPPPPPVPPPAPPLEAAAPVAAPAAPPLDVPAPPTFGLGRSSESLWTDAFDATPLGADPSAPWDPPVVPTAPPGRFEELVAAAARAEAEARAAAEASGAHGSGVGPASRPEPEPEPELRHVTPDRPLTSDPVSGEWAVAGLGGGIGPSRPRRSLSAPEPAPPSVPSDWDRLTTAASGRGQVSERGSWDFFDEPAEQEAEQPAAAGAGAGPASADPSTMSLPHWTEPATGEVPRILGGDPPPPAAADDEELSAWSALSTGPRWRDQPADWDEADFSDTVLDDREARVGALRDQPEPEDERDIFALDAASAPAVPASTPATGRGRGTATQARPTRGRSSRTGSGTRNGPGSGGPGHGGAGGRTGRPAGPGGQGGAAGGSDLTTRVITAVIAVGVLLAAAAIGARALVVLVLAAVTMAAAELFQSLRTRGYQPATLLGLVACASMVLATYIKGEPAFPLILTLLVIFSFLWYLAGVVHAKPTMNIAVTLFAFLYVGFLGSFACLFLRSPAGTGIGLLLGAIIATAAHDIGAYLVGKYMGKTPLAPELSPNKTFEGLVGGMLASVFVSLLIVSQIHPWNAGRAFWLGVVVAVTAPLGDLCESMIKRDLGVKDMGKLLPGHGGVLDRVDALLFVIPATYYLVRLIF